MLVLSRRKDEGIDITVPPTNHSVRIRLMTVEIRGASMRIGIDAPKFVTVDRREVTLRRAAESSGVEVHVRGAWFEVTFPDGERRRFNSLAKLEDVLDKYENQKVK